MGVAIFDFNVDDDDFRSRRRRKIIGCKWEEARRSGARLFMRGHLSHDRCDCTRKVSASKSTRRNNSTQKNIPLSFDLYTASRTLNCFSGLGKSILDFDLAPRILRTSITSHFDRTSRFDRTSISRSHFELAPRARSIHVTCSSSRATSHHLFPLIIFLYPTFQFCMVVPTAPSVEERLSFILLFHSLLYLVFIFTHIEGPPGLLAFSLFPSSN